MYKPYTTIIKMKSKQITINGVEITAHSDGSITKPFHSRTKRTFGTCNPRGYMTIHIGSKTHQVHRVITQAFLSDFLDFPQVDHMDGDGANNDISNLRMATNLSNSQSHKDKVKGCSSQYRGVSWQKAARKWVASCRVNYKRKYLGSFDDEREAAIARDAYAFSQGYNSEGLNFPENHQND